jgi:hypothetical protein
MTSAPPWESLPVFNVVVDKNPILPPLEKRNSRKKILCGETIPEHLLRFIHFRFFNSPQTPKIPLKTISLQATPNDATLSIKKAMRNANTPASPKTQANTSGQFHRRRPSGNSKSVPIFSVYGLGSPANVEHPF